MFNFNVGICDISTAQASRNLTVFSTEAPINGSAVDRGVIHQWRVFTHHKVS
jgi:hypothetical protein